MANFVIGVQVVCLLNLIIVASCEAYFDEFSSKLSTKLNDLTQAIERIHERLDKIERVVGITDDQPANGYDKEFNIMEEHIALIEIRRTKQRLMKAITSEKHHLKDFVSEYVDKFVDLQKNVTDKLSEMNDTIKESNKKITEEIDKNTINVSGQLNQMETEADLLFNDIGYQIATINSTATLERGVIVSNIKNVEGRVEFLEDKQSDHSIKLSSLESRMNSLNNTQESRVRSLDSQVSSIKSSLDSRISSLTSRISTLEGKKEAFSAFLTTTKYYGKGSIIVFDETVYSYGSGYSKSTGKFTAPKSGVYLFSVSVEGTDRERAIANMCSYKSGSKAIRGQASSGEDSFATGSDTIVYHLLKGEQMWVEAGTYGEFKSSRTAFVGLFISDL